MIDLLVAILCLSGCLAVLLAAVGVARFPDFFTRAHAATKASAFGLAALLLAACLTFPSLPTVLKTLAVIFALFLTLPVASQSLSHAALDEKDSESGEPEGASPPAPKVPH